MNQINSSRCLNFLDCHLTHKTRAVKFDKSKEKIMLRNFFSQVDFVPLLHYPTCCFSLCSEYRISAGTSWLMFFVIHQNPIKSWRAAMEKEMDEIRIKKILPFFSLLCRQFCSAHEFLLIFPFNAVIFLCCCSLCHLCSFSFSSSEKPSHFPSGTTIKGFDGGWKIVAWTSTFRTQLGNSLNLNHSFFRVMCKFCA